MQEIPLKVRYFERELSKGLKKLALLFLLNAAPYSGQDYETQRGLGTSE